ncbi:MAG: DeoR/GlpR family DNA-binding transcription regulator [Anaerovoracaceae bacterium]|nr:DeoR/GlpR family DNA-binding transcription regulator [Anaerovoracaceae bacterium]
MNENGRILKVKKEERNMLQNIRREKILNKLEINRAVKVADLVRELNTSESTIRRDIVELDREGKLKKVFGGAVPVEAGMVTISTDVAEREQINTEEKDRIARFAATLIENGDFVYIDAGTTTYRMIDHIENKSATYVTNGIVNARALVHKGFDVYMIGGILRPMTEAAVGPSAVDALNSFSFTKCFMGTNGIDLVKGFSTPDISEAAVKSAAIRNSGTSFILADHTKFGVVSSVSFAELGDAYIITDKVDDAYMKKARIKKIV